MTCLHRWWKTIHLDLSHRSYCCCYCCYCLNYSMSNGGVTLIAVDGIAPASDDDCWPCSKRFHCLMMLTLNFPQQRRRRSRVGEGNFGLVIWVNVAGVERWCWRVLAWFAFAPSCLWNAPADCKYCSPTEAERWAFELVAVDLTRLMMQRRRRRWRLSMRVALVRDVCVVSKEVLGLAGVAGLAIVAAKGFH